MTTLPKLDDKNANYVLEMAETVVEKTDNRRAGSSGEEQARHLFLNEIMKYCDEVSESNFITNPGAGTAMHKFLCIVLIICVLLFSLSVNGGHIAPAAISLILSLLVFGIFSYKFLFDGTKLDFFKPKKKSGNIMGKRYSRADTEVRVVLTSHIDAPQSYRSLILGNRWPLVLSIGSLIGNTLLFCSQLAFLFSGAPAGQPGFEFVRILCLLFIPIYIIGIFIVNPRVCSSGISASLIPSATILSVMKQFSEDSFRYEKTEFCFLITGAEYSSRAGAYAFAKKYRRLFSDVPTVFISLEEITTSEHLSVFFRDGSGEKGSTEIASVIAQAAENLEINLSKENSFMGSAAFTPFATQNFSACSLGTSKKNISKTVSPNEDKITAVRRKTVCDVAELIIETLNYYDS